MIAADVVVAAGTPHGRSAIAVVRLTGPGTAAIVEAIARPLRGGPLLHGRPRRVALADRVGEFDDGIALLRRGPATYTGEDLCELSIHGNPLLVERLVAACVDAGARLAAPGEFTRRAVVNGRMDLVRAEAVDQLVRATAAEGVRIAREALGGWLGAVLAELRERLVGVAAELEARLDWPGDELALEGDDALLATLAAVGAESRALAATCAAGRRLVEGARVAIVGPVNAGKSSLFNALLGRARALVHERPGTTRDVVEAGTRIGPLEVTLLDTAGERDTDDPIEAAGQALARELVDDAELLLVVLRASPEAPSASEERILARTAARERLVVYNGVDRAARPAPAGAIATSALTGAGIQALRDAIVLTLGAVPTGGPVIASVRQRDLLLAVARAADEARVALPEAGPAAAADAVVRGCEELDVLTGADPREAVLDAVFARFCIGK